MAELFNKGPKPQQKRPRGPYTQQEQCKRCKGSIHDSEGAYCFRLELCLEFDDGDVLLSKDGQAITCDGKDWKYREVPNA